MADKVYVVKRGSLVENGETIVAVCSSSVLADTAIQSDRAVHKLSLPLALLSTAYYTIQIFTLDKIETRRMT